MPKQNDLDGNKMPGVRKQTRGDWILDINRLLDGRRKEEVEASAIASDMLQIVCTQSAFHIYAFIEQSCAITKPGSQIKSHIMTY